MNTNPQIYHGEWWVPALVDRDPRMVYPEPEKMMGHEKRYMGIKTAHWNYTIHPVTFIRGITIKML